METGRKLRIADVFVWIKVQRLIAATSNAYRAEILGLV